MKEGHGGTEARRQEAGRHGNCDLKFQILEFQITAKANEKD
jgi:hypothetical protein